ncbi:recombination protein F [Streptococcus criceti]|uniref:DNA replication and repair protein RecF n=1 Tax=Streptococcus criceti HS-6 TaxID=873449 RepID=G5JPN2_STRCG|nr:DNA replication/repair protein RecF [Streptococcus criceti]EHI74601.1 DNA replication and repair protein RecF [Streptococcus criceti HS-6]SUN41876.1 recombination protein F [Streptococcus criceti]
MWLEAISLKNFRNYSEMAAEFSSGLNIFLGQNAQGKTNFLEAIYFLALTRSHRTRSDKELINFHAKELSVSGILRRTSGKLPLEINLSDKGRTTKVNYLKQAKLSDYIGNMTVVLFAPEDLQLVKGAPSLRRKFLDIDLGQIKPVYLSDLSNYNHVLKQRNAYLKAAKVVDKDYLAVIDEQLADFGSRVMEHRYQFVQNLALEADKHHHIISNQLEHLKISYQSSVKFQEPADIKQNFLGQLAKSFDRDSFKKNTGVGPHRDDLAFFINDMNASFGSQGQQRSLILSLKLAEIELIKATTGDTPILLLDDVMSELDYHRQLRLLDGIKENVQTFITTTSLDHLQGLPDNLKIFTVDKGIIKGSGREPKN